MKPGNDIEGFLHTAGEIADILRECSSVRIIAHIDADGISSASIASLALEREGIPHQVRFVKKLGPEEIDDILKERTGTVWFVDLASGSYSRLLDSDVVICDHHVPDLKRKDRPSRGQNRLYNFISCHLNPHLFGIDGSSEISGAGVTYFVAKEMDGKNRDLSALAIVGAVGDFQDSAECRLKGLNRIILEEAEEQDLIETITDLRIFGRETRPLDRFLQYSTDPYLPGLTGRYRLCKSFLDDLGIQQKGEGGWRRWIDLEREEKRRIASALVHRLMDSGMGAEAVRRLIGEVYILKHEEAGTELHDAKEFSTLLNACGRYGKAEIGMAICRGNRDDSLREAIQLQRRHRENLSHSIDLVNRLGLQRRQWIQHFHGKGVILDSIVGIVAGMMLGSGEIDYDVPIVAFANSEDNKVKVSARGTKEMVRKGLDLAHAVKIAAEKVGGAGGGHDIAAGATIDRNREEDFLRELEAIIAAQLGDPDREP